VIDRHLFVGLIAVALLAATGCEGLSGTADDSTTTESPAITSEIRAPATEDAPSTSEDPPMTETSNPVVIIETTKGVIEVELWPDESPLTVANFLQYVDAGHYDGLIFHRVMSGFMIQGGGFTPGMNQKAAPQTVENEARADVPNERGTLAMARTSDPHSASAQFFINHADNSFLNHSDKSPQGWGYCVFGKVLTGMDVVDAIAAVQTASAGMHDDVPTQPITIVQIRRK